MASGHAKYFEDENGGIPGRSISVVHPMKPKPKPWSMGCKAEQRMKLVASFFLVILVLVKSRIAKNFVLT